YANLIRKVDSILDIGDKLAHWAAILAMNQNGINLTQQYSEIKSFEAFNELKKTNCAISVFLPYKFLKQTDELPHSWSVTSDSITLYLAHKLNLSECFLIKDIDGIYIEGRNQVVKQISTKEYVKLRNSNDLAKNKEDSKKIKKSMPIDSHLVKLIESYKIHCIILNGMKDKDRLVNYFQKNRILNKIFTKINY
ncbi:unnamed protein product, partial [marine sediment metagenome]